MKNKVKVYKNQLVNRIDRLIDKISCLKTCLQKTGIRDNREKFAQLRTIFINNQRPDGYVGAEAIKYKDNQITTSKYTLLNFIPKNLFEQFRRVANFYFLINCIILFLIPDPPTTPYASAFPLLFVILVTAIKQGIEDISRHREDRKVNYKKVRVLRKGKFDMIRCRDIKCGDIVQVNIDEAFPCDMLLLYAVSESGGCFIKTANLDGETNLKQRTIPKKLPVLGSEQDLMDLRGVVSCEKPNARLYEFKGTLLIGDKIYAINNENILLRGTTLQVASSIYGCVVYAGQDTKMMQNSKFKSNKLSCVEKRMNYFVSAFILILIGLSLVCVFGSIYFQNDNIYSNHWYLRDRVPLFYNTNRTLFNFITFVSFMNLNYIIPLSLYITLETIRLVGSKFFEWDCQMYDEATDQPAKVNSTDLNEDLGQIEYLFSDKTGTLTINEMVFKHFCIDGHIFEESHGRIYRRVSQDLIEQEILNEEKVARFIEALSVCHTVQIQTDSNNNEIFNASSPDELSFIKFCSKIGVHFKGDTLDREASRTIRRIEYTTSSLDPSNLQRKPPSVFKEYELLNVLEFDSNRKRMSIIVRDVESDQYLLFCKGADSSMFVKASKRDSSDMYQNSLRIFSENGWRTLVVAFKLITQKEYEKCREQIDDANNDITNRETKLAQAYEEIENDLSILGVTSVEDKLQEGVENTLYSLRKAGIKIWVLTGDKLETAINISESCRHFSRDMIKFVLRELKNPDEIRQQLSIIDHEVSTHEEQSYALVIDGETLGNLIEANLQKDLRDVSMKCAAVLCCRMSPSQKALIVKLIKTSKKKPMTCAIGDGANDVSMIQEAHVGVGIFGKEGRNAARSADFAFAKFKHLKRALLVHGYLYYTRASNLVLYFFYKNFVFAICQFYYAFWNAFSTTSLFNSLFLSVFNLALTSVPVFVYALFEQQNSIEKLESNPLYYRLINNNAGLSPFQFIKWVLIGVWHSVVSFYSAFNFFQTNYMSDGKLGGLSVMGSLILIFVVLIVHFKLILVWKYITPFTLLSYIASVCAFVVFCLLINSFIMPYPLTLFTDEQALYFSFFNLFPSASFWFTALVTVVISLLPDVVLAVVDQVLDAKQFEELERSEQASRMRKRSIFLNYIRNKMNNSPTSNDVVVNENVSLHNIPVSVATICTCNKRNKPPTDHDFVTRI